MSCCDNQWLDVRFPLECGLDLHMRYPAGKVTHNDVERLALFAKSFAFEYCATKAPPPPPAAPWPNPSAPGERSARDRGDA
jgi:hypothetical protein